MGPEMNSHQRVKKYKNVRHRSLSKSENRTINLTPPIISVEGILVGYQSENKSAKKKHTNTR